ncbi:TonB-dependent receptor plug domain-containing protein [Hydrogenimonas sp.]
MINRTGWKRLGFALCALLFCAANASEAAETELDELLGAYAQQSDLSQKTKKESGGFLQVYTRQDLDRMQIRQLKELLEKVPFIRYAEDNLGLSDPFYLPYQPGVSNGVRIYINDRSITTTYSSNALRLFGQMGMEFIDHVEIYLGVPSQTFGIEGAIIVIKLYTKDPAREETSLLGAILGSRGTQKFYAYDAHTDGKESGHLLYANYTKLNRQSVPSPTTGLPLKRDKEYATAYLQYQMGHHRFEGQFIQGRTDAFLGTSPAMNSANPDFDYRYGYAGWFFDNPQSGWKAFLYGSTIESEYQERVATGNLGYIQRPYPQLPIPFHRSFYKVKEQVIDAQLRKSFNTGNVDHAVGIQARYKHFNIKNLELDGISFPVGSYNSERIISIFSEQNWLVDPSNILTASLKVDRYLENGGIDDQTLWTGRLGYIYNNETWTSKTFLMYADAMPSMETLYNSRYIFHQSEFPSKIEHDIGIGTRLTYRNGDDSYSLLISRTIRQNAFAFDGRKYVILPDMMQFDGFDFEYVKEFDALNRFKLDAWEVISRYNNNIGSGKTYGVVASLTNTIDRWDIHNDVVYKYFRSVGQPGLDWNMALTYHATRQLSLFFKANNILGRALKENYYSIDPWKLQLGLPGAVTELKGVDVFDKRVWIGMEYQF